MLKYLAYFLIGLISGCSSLIDYYGPEEFGIGDVKYYAGNPDKFRVKKGDYPVYTTLKTYSPPELQYVILGRGVTKEQIEILNTDEWVVTHKIDELIIIQSETYTDRQCRYLAKQGKHHERVNIIGVCTREHDLGIGININDEIKVGWILLPSRSIGGSNRRVYIPLEPIKNESWLGEKIFTRKKQQ